MAGILLNQITGSINCVNRNSEEFRILRQGLSYCWSVAVASLPARGKPLMEKWPEGRDKDIIWIMNKNLKKNRMKKIDPVWVERWTAYLELSKSKR